MDSNSGQAEGQNALRDDLIATAVAFLQNPKVQSTPLQQRREFLKKKGLTELEINAAFERFNAASSLMGNPGMAGFAHYADGPPIYAPPRTTWRDYANVAVIFGGFSYAAYHFCKRYVFPRWLGIPDPDEERFSRLTEMISQSNNSVQFLSDSIQQTLTAVRQQQDSVQTLMQHMQQSSNGTRNTDLQEVRNDINIVKGILLSRNQFPPLPNMQSSPVLPAWQMQVQQKSATPNADVGQKKENLTNGFHSTEKFHLEENAENDDEGSSPADGAEV